MSSNSNHASTCGLRPPSRPSSRGADRVNHDIDACHGHLDDPHDDGGKDRGNDGERSGTDASSGSRAVVRMLESVLLMSLPDRAEDGSLFCLAGVIVVEAVRASQFAMPE